MNFITTALLAGVGCILASAQSLTAQTCGGNAGPDDIVGEINGVANYNSLDGIDAFALGDTHCNMGTENLVCDPISANHPVMAMHMYRYGTVGGVGRFEQIGMSWVGHELPALTQNLCCTCNGQGGTVLGVGCSNPHTAGWRGAQSETAAGLGPRFQVNAHTGAFIWPYQFRNDSTYIPETSITRRLQAHVNDLNPALHDGALYYMECAYVTPDDAAAFNQDNNVSYRRAIITGNDPNYTASITGMTQRAQPAIRAWAVIDPLVQLTDLNTPETTPGSGDTTSFGILGSRVTDLGNGQYHYEYALYNMNSDRSFSSFSVPSSRGLVVSNIGFHDVSYHSGDGYNSSPDNVVTFDDTDWSGNNDGSNISWALIPADPIENSNAVRWGTLYNFRFDCNSAPTPGGGDATVGLFKAVASLPDTMTALTQIPGPVIPCPADITGNGATDIDDLLTVINAWGTSGGGGAADIDDNGTVNIDDLLAVINAWGPCE
jgi:hypothetical protein